MLLFHIQSTDTAHDACILIHIEYIGGWIMLIVGFQPLMVISPTASWIRWCMQVFEYIGTYAVTGYAMLSFKMQRGPYKS